ncbi:hypothetical protein [Phenylobacterium sp.]|uniref:hypothetical protein n=1 Tax=Phenylobacterium sp. TaxID=1871053 RepID=UPI002810CC3A|nr:hypothetical protein [Phenylobacterium sp.]
MNVPSDRVPESASPAYDRDVPPPEILALDQTDAFDLHREINTRRAQLENSELLRHIRSL